MSALDQHLAACPQCRKGPVLCSKGRALAARTPRKTAASPPAELDDDLTWLS